MGKAVAFFFALISPKLIRSQKHKRFNRIGGKVGKTRG
jgi:hypothetical protein